MEKEKITRFRSTLRKFERELEIQISNSCCCSVSKKQCHVLMELSVLEGASLNQLSERLSVDKSTASRMIDTLVSKSMVEREIPPENRRSILLQLSPEGERVSRRINEMNNEYFARVLSPVPADELHTFLNVFEKITNTMKSMNSPNW